MDFKPSRLRRGMADLVFYLRGISAPTFLYLPFVTLPYDVCIVCLPVGVELLVERYKFFEERVTLGVGAGGAVERKRAEAQEQIKQWLETPEAERDYAVGALYLLKLSGNQIMYRNTRSRGRWRCRAKASGGADAVRAYVGE